MLISPAYAQAGGDPTGGLMSLLPLLLIFVVFYFILIRPQQKKAKDHRAMLSDIKRGERIVTGGGIIATVIRVAPDNDEVIVEIAKDTRVKIVKGTIQTVLREPAEAAPAQDNKPPEGKGQEGRKRSRGEAKPGPEAGPEPASEPSHEPTPEPGPEASGPAEPPADGTPPANDPEPPRQG